MSTNTASVSTQQSELLDATLTSTLGLPAGNAVDLTAADYQALADADLNLSSIVDALNAAGVGTDGQTALDTSTSLDNVLGALSVSATASGKLDAAAVLNKLRQQTASINTQGIRLSGLIDADTRDAQLEDSQLNLLDLVTGTASVFNKSNAVALREVTISGSQLGLPGQIATVRLSAVVIEPAVAVCGPTGSQFYSASIRVRARLSLTGTGLDLTLSPLTSVRLNLGQLDLVAAIGRASGTITGVNVLANTLSVTVTPGVAELYLGTISDANFVDRTTPIDPNTEVTPMVIGDLQLRLLTLTATATVSAKSYALGTAPTPRTLNFTGPYEQTLTATTQSGFVGTLVTSLLNNLQITIGTVTGNLGIVGTALDMLTANLTTAVGNALRSSSGILAPLLTGTLTGAIDPLLSSLGIKLGEVSVTAGAPHDANGSSCDDGLFCTQNDVCNASGICTGGTPRTCADAFTCTVDSCDEASDSCRNVVDNVSCFIANSCVPANDPDPGNSCRQCNPAASKNVYTLKATPECVGGDGGTLCPGGCVIAGSCVAATARSPSNACQVCNPAVSTNSFVNAASGLPCEDGQFCTSGDACDGNGACVGGPPACGEDGLTCTSQACDETANTCSTTVTTGCVVGNRCYADGQVSPNDPCAVCDGALSRNSFSYQPTSASCIDSRGDGGIDMGPGLGDGGAPDGGQDMGNPLDNPDAGRDAGRDASIDAATGNRDAGTPDAESPEDRGGIAGAGGCAVPQGSSSGGALWMLASLAILLSRRRRQG